MPDSCVRELRAHRARQAQEKLILGSGYEDNDLVFCAEQGGLIDPRSFCRQFDRVIRKAGLEHIPFHALRHTFATMALQEGVSVKAIQETLGHHTAAFTLAAYGHVTESMKREAADKIGNLLARCAG